MQEIQKETAKKHLSHCNFSWLQPDYAEVTSCIIYTGSAEGNSNGGISYASVCKGKVT